MPDVEQINGVLDTQSLTVGELILTGVIVLVSVFLARHLRHLIRWTLASRPNLEPHVPETVARVTGWVVVLSGFVLALIVLGLQVGPVVLIGLFFAGMAGISARTTLEIFAAGIKMATPELIVYQAKLSEA